jgi:hypothetical protein
LRKYSEGVVRLGESCENVDSPAATAGLYSDEFRKATQYCAPRKSTVLAMKALTERKNISGAYRARGMVIALILMAVASPAFAKLGEAWDSIQADQSCMQAELQVREFGAYSVYEMQMPIGTVVREYVSLEGRVFAVSWRGPFIPDLRLILGTYFQHYSRSTKAHRKSSVGRQPLHIQEAGLVVETAGHMRAYWGRAFDPGLLPRGVGIDAIR